MEHVIDEENSYSDDEVNKDLLDLFIAPLNEENVNFTLLHDLIEFNPREFKFFSPVLLRTAIFQFVWSTEVLKFLLDHGADPNQQHEGKHCLVQAAKSGSKAVVELLLERGADPEASNFQAYPDSIVGSFSSHYYDASAESVASDEGHHEIAQIIHRAKHRKPTNDYRIVTQLISDILDQDPDNGTGVRDDRVHLLIDSGNPCITCQDQNGCTLVEALFRRSCGESLRMLSSADISIKLRDDKALQLMFSEKIDAATFPILIESAPAMLGDINPTFEVPLIQHLIQKGHADKLACFLSLLETIAKTENNLPTDISEVQYDKTTILHIACETGNVAIIRRLVQSLSLLGESKKCQNKLHDVINYVDISRKAQKDSKQVCLQILIRHPEIRPNERLDLIRLLLDKGANPNLKFGFHELTKDSNVDTMSLLLCASEAGDERLDITQLLMDYHAKDKGQYGLKSAILAVDTDLSDVIFANTWPATSDAGNQASFQPVFVPKLELYVA